MLKLIVILITAMLLAPISEARHVDQYSSTRKAVCYYFPGYLCQQAMNVVACETGRTYSPWASNGQYLGIFQMGSQERATFGYGNDVWSQARGARNYYNYEIRNHSWGWAPWSCHP